MEDNKKFEEIHQKRRVLEKEYEERLAKVEEGYALPYGAMDPSYYGAYRYEDIPPRDDTVDRLAKEIQSLLEEEKQYKIYINPNDLARESGKELEEPWNSKYLEETIKRINQIAEEGKAIQIRGTFPTWVLTSILYELSQKNIPVMMDVEGTNSFENVTFHTHDKDLQTIKQAKEYSKDIIEKRVKENQVLLNLNRLKNIDDIVLPEIDSKKDVYISTAMRMYKNIRKFNCICIS